MVCCNSLNIYPRTLEPENLKLRVPRLLSNPNASVGIICGIKIFALHFNWPRFVRGQLGLFTVYIYLKLPPEVPNIFSPASSTRQKSSICLNRPKMKIPFGYGVAGSQEKWTL